MNSFKQYQNHMTKKILKYQRSGEWRGYEECEDFSHFSYPF